jgi:hypothetical protein
MQRAIDTPPGGPPEGPGPSKDISGAMGEENIFRMMADFYGQFRRALIVK